MFVLQDCSICLEDYDIQRTPHMISCGHVFCRPCLVSLSAYSSNCPHCRAPFTVNNINKIVCTYQDPPAPSEAEAIMWQAIVSAVELTEDREQRKVLVQRNPRQATQEAGFSENLLIALDLMRVLVEVEGANRLLINRLQATRANEVSLYDRISLLEGQLSGSRTGFGSSQEFRTLLSEMQDLKSSVRTINKTTIHITRQLNTTGTPLTMPTAEEAYFPEPSEHALSYFSVSSLFQRFASSWREHRIDNPNSVSSRVRSSASTSAHTLCTITAAYDSAAYGFNQLIFDAGETLELVLNGSCVAREGESDTYLGAVWMRECNDDWIGVGEWRVKFETSMPGVLNKEYASG
ncbi:hypothetical protein BDV93DRAFT_545747 [Ceratobasidium sp. AG-I]|nr:hypothetical protein BDV93DRAFT_545747 [Ceratobasidium sp. AG-I]